MNKSILDSYHSNEGFSFGGKHLLYEKYPNINKKEINKILSASDIYTKYKQYSKPRKYSPIYVRNKRELFQCDLISFTQNNLPQENDGFKHLFTTIDVFSKMAWVYPIRDKKCETVLSCFKDILQKCGKKPQRVQTDRGTEFICKTFEKYFREEIIYHYLSYSDRKCPVIERFNLTIQQLIYKIMEYKSTNRWIDCIDQAMEIYLNRKHSTVKMSPLEAEKAQNETEVRRNLFEYFTKRSRGKPQKQKFNVGDKVRVWKYHRAFKRGYDKNFTDEYFTIYKVLKNLPVIRYQLKDFNGDKIVGNYFQEELVLYEPKNFYKINIIDEKGHGKAKKYLINWEGWPDTYNQWILASDVEDIQTNVENDFESNDTFGSNPIEKTFEQNDITDDVEDENENNITNSSSFKKTQVKYADDLNIPNIRENLVNKKTQLKYTDDINIQNIMDDLVSKRKKKRKLEKASGGKKIVKVNVINDAQINLIKNFKRK